MKQLSWVHVVVLAGCLAAGGQAWSMEIATDEPMPVQDEGVGVSVFLPSGLRDMVGAAALAAVGPESQAAEAAIEAAQARVNAAAEKVRSTRTRVDAGQTPSHELAAAEAAYKVAVADLAEKKAEIATMRGIFGFPSAVGGKLSKPVDVQLQQSTVRQAAEALARASGVPIEVGAGVPKDVRITIDARRMPLSTVLEAIGKQTGLMIAPEGEGVRLDVWPSLTVDGVKTTQKTGRIAPWSDEWGIPPTRFSGLTAAMAGLPDIFVGGRGGNDVTRRILAPGARPDGLEVYTSGDTVVVSEVGRNDKGEAGLWLTAYRMVGGKMEPAGSTFHPFRGSTPGSVDGVARGALSLRFPAVPARPARPPAPPRPPANL